MPAFEEGSALKAQGNAAFQAGRLEDAIVLYDRAVAVLHSPDAHKGGGGGVSDDERRIITQKLACDVLNQVRAKLELEGRNAADVKRRVVTAFTKIAGKDLGLVIVRGGPYVYLKDTYRSLLLPRGFTPMA